VSLSPCATIEHSTTSAAMSKIRSAPGTPEPRTSSENVIVATPFGPNQAMKASAARDTPVPISAIASATGRATRSVTSTIATAAHPSRNRPSIVSSDPNTTKIPSLTISTMSSARAST